MEISKSFIVAGYAKLFHLLSAVTPFSLLRTAIPWLRRRERSYAVVEAWVLGNAGLALASAVYVYLEPNSFGVIILLTYGAWRTFEIVVVQMNVLFFDEWRARKAGEQYSLRGYRRIAILLMHNYAEIVFWFTAVLITMGYAALLEIKSSGFFEIFRASLVSMVSFSSGEVRALNSIASMVLAVQSIIGILMTVLTLTRFVSLIPAPVSQDELEQ